MEVLNLPKFRFILVLLVVLPISQCAEQNGRLIKTPQLKSGLLTRNRRQRPETETAIPPDIALGNNPNVSETGRWGPWSESSPCSRPCGGGVAHQTRRCLDLRPDGNPACTGPSRKYYSCNIQDCSEGTVDFRTEQCSRFNGVPFDGRYYEWVPYKALSKCELNCMPKGEHFYYRHARKVIDGTRCDTDAGMDVCVDGVCFSVGCDMMLGSNAVEDKCRECGGDGSGCDTRQDVYDNDNLPIGYNDILLIPPGATTISIQEKHATNNYLAVRNLKGQYYLNGNWRIDFPRDLHFAGTTWIYERRAHGVVAPESLRAVGPTTEPLYIVLLYQESNPGIDYEYSVPKGVTPAPQAEAYSWVYGQYGQCTRTCGGGEQVRAVSCARTAGFEVVADYLCDPLMRPLTTRTCSTQSCPPSWFMGNWEECSSTCGGGVQFRVVYCQRVSNGNSLAVVPHEECVKETGPRPSHTRRCNDHIKCPAWHPGPWSPCDRICGLGDQSRVLTCQRRVNGQLELFPDSACSSLDKPPVHQNCTNGPCEGVDWIVSDWTGCDACSILLESRTALCSTQGGKLFPDAICDTRRLPNLRRDCPESPPCEVMWYTTQWSECSTKCGNGVQTRVVFCGTTNEESIRKVDSSLCDPKKRYDDYKNCTGPPCEGLWFTGPWNRCTAPCGGGHRTRKVLCLVEELVVENKLCDPSSKPLYKENCNPSPCDDDEILTVGGCKDSKHGCCPDGVTAAGPNFEKCPTPAPSTGGCETTEFGCCADGVSPALGPFRKGCAKVTKCEETKFKCCPDNVTPAKGLDNEGCPVPETCAQTKHGCCPDGIEAAQGPDFAGCQFITSNACNDTEFGCCADNFTVAGGPDGENCPSQARNDTVVDDDVDGSGDGDPCAGLDLGACGDSSNVTSNATIDCEDAPFGCCSDGASAAEGPEGSGCEIQTDTPMDCENTLHGCCPDGINAALGPDHEGCDEKLSTVPANTVTNATDALEDDKFPLNFTDVADVVTYPPDWDYGNYTIVDDGLNATEVNVTTVDPEIVEWLNETTTEVPGNQTSDVTEVHGNQTSDVTEPLLPTPVYDCAQTLYGCCPDGSTAAHGEADEGCPTVDHGHCSSSPFGCCPDESTPARGPSYGGCGCETYPHHCCPDGISPALGPHYTGCSCETFVHGCCPDGRTPSRGPNYEGCGCDATEHGCCPDGRTAATGPNYEGCGCQATYYGCCPDNRTPATGPKYEGCGCEASYYGCCPDGRTPAHGTNHEGCVPEKVMKPGDVCSLPKERGSCRNFTVKWFFDMDYGGCSRFWYGGCEGNDNRFETQEECQQVCVAPEGTDACRLPKVVGPCDALIASWYYDASAGNCASFTYGGCLGNNNRFETKEICEETCRKPDEMDPCLEPKVEGPCRGYFVRWFYDKEDGHCKEFVYGGCKGNNNNFESEQECVQQCASRSEKDICVLPRETGPCRAFLPRWYHDVSDGLCKQFTYGGCQGNKNRFKTKELCEHTCNTTKVGDESCSLPRAQGPCSNYEVLWYFDQADGRCRQFYYGGCEGNPNRFKNEQECAQTCPEQPPIAVCSLAQSLGNCFDYENRFFFDGSVSQCRGFIYGGCGGNQNNFYTVEECEHRCGATHVQVPKQDDFKLEYCHLAEDKGPCYDSITKWHYDKSDGVCKQFQYGGCQGNENRFSSLHECEERCTYSQDICQLPRIAGPCSGTFTQWAFDSQQGSCQEFTFGGCEGNANRFDSLQACEERCRGQEVTTDQPTDSTPQPEQETTPQQPPQYEEICRSTPDPGPCSQRELRWYHDPSDRSCKTFVYGGCLGNYNRFETAQHCEEICDVQQRPIETTTTTTATTEAPVTPHPQANNWTQTCVLPSDPGHCNNLEPRWYYEPLHSTCIPFAYGGCGGNQNNFLTYETCLTTCATSQPCPDPGDCGALACPYGPEEGRDWRGCVLCRCAEPCRDYECPEGSQCTVEVHVDEGGVTRAQPICRQDLKPGECPAVRSSSGDHCEQECSSDLDCPDVLKCCYNGCGFSCILANAENREVGTETESPLVVPQDVAPSIAYSDDEVVASSGDSVTLRCTAHGSPAPQVIWTRGGQPIVDDRFRQMPDGSLVIEGVTHADDGLYSCVVSNSAGVAEKSTQLVVQGSSKEREEEASPTPEPRPAEIIEGPRVVVAPLNLPQQLDCRAIGWPKPTVTWWREARMLPRYSEQYQQYANYSLLIRSVTIKDLGPYQCRAYNNIGQVAVWEVTVFTDTDAPAVLEDPTDLKYFGRAEDLDRQVPRDNPVNGNLGPAGNEVSNDIVDQPDRPEDGRNPAVNPGNLHGSNHGDADVDPTQDNTPQSPPPPDWGSVPVSARVVAENTQVDSDAPLLLDCISSGSPRVVWYKDEVLVEQDNRTLIFPNGTLLVPHARPDDAGVYKCEASNEFNRALSSVNITVNGMYVPPGCSDNPYFANCKLIVKAKYCKNRYYARFCCRSCTLAGQLTAEDIAAIQDNLV